MTVKPSSLTGSIIYSHFRYLCPYHTWQLFHIGVPDKIPTPSEKLLMEMGLNHEEQTLAHFQKEYGDECIVISGEEGWVGEDDIKTRFGQTLNAMAEGKAVIYHGILVLDEERNSGRGGYHPCIGEVRGEPDFLFKVNSECKSRFGKYHYEVGDAKSSRSSRFCQQMQVTFYSWLLEGIQGVMPRFGSILTRPIGIEGQPMPCGEEFFLIDDYIWTLKSFLEEELAEILERKEEDMFFHPTSVCETCCYHEQCVEKITKSSDLSILPDIRKIQKRHMNRAGILDIKSLACANDDLLRDASRASGVTLEGLNKLKLQALSITENRPVFRGLFKTLREAGLAVTKSELDLPGEKDATTAIDFTDPKLAHVYLDMESDPYSDFEYLFGVMVDEPGKRGGRKKGKAEFFMCEGYGPDGEFLNFMRFLKRMDRIRRDYGEDGYALFHYGHYEPTHMSKLAEKYEERKKGLIDRVDFLNRRMVDLYKLVRKTFYLPTASYSIKDVAPCIKTLMTNNGLKGGHEWKKIQGIEGLQKDLLRSGWLKKGIEDSIREVQKAIRDFGLKDEAMIFDASAEMSVVWFKLFDQRKKKVWRRLIETYNQDDLMATWSVVEWLLFMGKDTEIMKR